MRVTSGVRHIVERSGAQDGGRGRSYRVSGLKMSRADNGNADFGRRGPELCDMGIRVMLFGPNGPEHEAHSFSAPVVIRASACRLQRDNYEP